ncbi:MAG: hypothetical protein ACTSQE_12700 [Candidatus Heimdallarchaeaceae archaeon]
MRFEKKKKIEYQCNLCCKKRVLIIPKGLVKAVGVEGLSSYVDVHSCREELEALILYVDAEFNVRSQVPVKSSSTQAEPNDPTSILNIPSPKKGDLVSIAIQSKGFTPFNLISLQLKDQLRQANYVIEGKLIKKKKTKTMSNISRLGFVEVKTEVYHNR